jgi:hypothetical protein
MTAELAARFVEIMRSDVWHSFPLMNFPSINSMLE